jgi:hypothetical protein
MLYVYCSTIIAPIIYWLRGPLSVSSCPPHESDQDHNFVALNGFDFPDSSVTRAPSGCGPGVTPSVIRAAEQLASGNIIHVTHVVGPS